jgi:hypothetical protein
VRRPLVRLAVAAGTLIRFGVHRALPGVLGMAAVSVGAGELAGHIFGRGLSPWVGLVVAGGFALVAGAEVNRGQRWPPGDDG